MSKRYFICYECGHKFEAESGQAPSEDLQVCPAWQAASRITTPNNQAFKSQIRGVISLAIERIIKRVLLIFIFLFRFIRNNLILGGLPIIRADQNTTTAHFTQA